MKLSPKIILLVLGILLVSMSLLSIPLYWYSRVALEDALGEQLQRISLLVRNNLDPGLINALISEPQLSGVRGSLETELGRYAVPGIEGMFLYAADGRILAQERQVKNNLSKLSSALPGLLSLNDDSEVTVSEIYQLDNGLHVKAAAVPIRGSEGLDAVLVVWAGASYMTIIQQMTGSLFWIILVSVLIAITLTAVFTRSLIKPVRQLSSYARSIQANISTPPVLLNRKDEFGDLNRSLVDMHADIQKQEESARQLLAGIAHEIKNPLGGMEIYSGLLQDELADLNDQRKVAEVTTYLSKITHELGHLKQIVQEYLDYARPLKSVIETVNLKEVYEDVVPLISPELLTVDRSLSITGDAQIPADRSKLHRVFLNLLQNSLEAVGQTGQVGIHIQTEQDTVIIEFSDDGAGIPQADWERIFEPYFSTRDRGFGLGLAIVKSIVQEMGGTILVQKSNQQGTVIQLKLPGKDKTLR